MITASTTLETIWLRRDHLTRSSPMAVRARLRRTRAALTLLLLLRLLSGLTLWTFGSWRRSRLRSRRLHGERDLIFLEIDLEHLNLHAIAGAHDFAWILHKLVTQL